MAKPNQIYSFFYKFFLVFLSILSQSVAISLKAELYDARSFEFLRSSSYPHFVMFYAPWCGHCKRVQPVWDKYSEDNQKTRRMKVAKVDCTESTPLCSAENIKAYPTFILYHPIGSLLEKFIFKGSRNIVEFNQFANEKINDLKDGQVPVDSTIPKMETTKEDVGPVFPKLLTADTFEAEIAKDYTFVDFYAPWCSHCNKLEPTWNKLAEAVKYSKKLTIAKVDCTADPDLCQKHNINGYPTLNLYKNGALASHYNQARSLASLIEFVQLFMSTEDESNRRIDFAADLSDDIDVPPVPSDEGSEGLDVPGPVSDEASEGLYDPGPVQSDESGDRRSVDPPEYENLEEKLSDESYKEALGKSAHLIYFHDSGPKFSNMDLLIFEQIQSKLRISKKDVSVAVIDCTKTTLVCHELQIDTFPSILYFRSLSKHMRYEGPVDVDGILSFVDMAAIASREDEKEVKDEL